MGENDGKHGADPEAVLDYLKKTIPFRDLDDEVLRDIAGKFTQDFYPKGTLILEQGVSEVDSFQIIIRGGVKVLTKEPDGSIKLVDFRGEGGYFGALGIIKQSSANFCIEAAEDTFCYLLDREDFLRLVQSRSDVANHFLEGFSDQMVAAAYAEMRDVKKMPGPEKGLYLFSAKVGEVVRRPPEMIAGSESVQAAAARMTSLDIGSLLVLDQSEKVVGIVTDNDLRTKVVAAGLNYDTPVAEIASSPLRSVPSTALCFDALLQMMNQQVHHLAVERDGAIVGMMTAHDIMVQQGTSPISLFRQIISQRKIEGLYVLSEKVPYIVGTLIHEGAKANNITRMIAVLNDHIVARVLQLLVEEIGPAPHPWCWLMLGSEGRLEQTFKTDQDNALIYEDPPQEWERIKAAKLYFRRLGNEAIKHLEACGYPLCKGQMMASNPKWRKSYHAWQGYFDRWMAAPEPQAVLHSTIFFDFRPGYGTLKIAERLRDHISTEAPKKGIFLMHMAKDALTTKAPLSFFRHFIVEKDGRYKNRLDLKTRGLVPFVDFARVLALKYGIRETNTIARLEAIAAGDYIPRELYVETREAYEFQMQVRLVHQFRRLRAGLTPDNYIDPVDLSDSEKQTLKDAFAVINRLQSFVKEELKVME
jgi:CBS domain-containing protein